MATDSALSPTSGLQFAADFTEQTHLGPAGETATTAQLNAAKKLLQHKKYVAHRTLSPVSCRGGNSVEQCVLPFSTWLGTLNPSSFVPVHVMLAPLSNLLPPSPQQAAMAAALQQLIGASLSDWKADIACPSACQNGGTCTGSQVYCTCPNAHTAGRMCEVCDPGYAGTECTKPSCIGCNVKCVHEHPPVTPCGSHRLLLVPAGARALAPTSALATRATRAQRALTTHAAALLTMQRCCAMTTRQSRSPKCELATESSRGTPMGA